MVEAREGSAWLVAVLRDGDGNVLILTTDFEAGPFHDATPIFYPASRTPIQRESRVM